jgi:hypothetical protein
MATPVPRSPSFESTAMELETLQLLPCGCVTSVRRVRPWDYLFVSIEAKGPHCILAPHRPGRVVQIGNRFDLDDGSDDDIAL